MKKGNGLAHRNAGIVGLIVLMIIGVGCKKDTEHYVRVTNNFTEPMKEVKLDEINYGIIDSGATTAYKYVLEGTFPISVTTKSGFKSTGMAYVEGGEGKQHWTIFISGSGVISAVKDN